MKQTINAQVFDYPLTGLNIPAGSTLGDAIGDNPTLLVFLRHFGCIFCRETVADIKALTQKHAAYPPVIFFYQGTTAEGAAFFEGMWPQARAVSDIPKTFYGVFNIDRGGMKEMFGPEVWACGVRATLKGHRIGLKTGDPWTMPGLFLLHGTQVLWTHDFRHAGDHPNFTRVLDYLPEDIPEKA